METLEILVLVTALHAWTCDGFSVTKVTVPSPGVGEHDNTYAKYYAKDTKGERWELECYKNPGDNPFFGDLSIEKSKGIKLTARLVFGGRTKLEDLEENVSLEREGNVMKMRYMGGDNHMREITFPSSGEKEVTIETGKLPETDKNHLSVTDWHRMYQITPLS